MITGKRIWDWMVNHDESWVFTVSYLGLALALSVFIGLFWLVVVVAIHGILELVRHKAITGKARLAVAAWKIKLDIVLVLFALVVSLYMDFVLGMAGLAQAARLGAKAGGRIGARIAGWERVLKAVFLSADDAAQVLRAAFTRGAGKETPKEEASQADQVKDRGLSKGDWFSMLFGAACLILILASPLLLPLTPLEALKAILAELHPLGSLRLEA